MFEDRSADSHVTSKGIASTGCLGPAGVQVLLREYVFTAPVVFTVDDIIALVPVIKHTNFRVSNYWDSQEISKSLFVRTGKEINSFLTASRGGTIVQGGDTAVVWLQLEEGTGDVHRGTATVQPGVWSHAHGHCQLLPVSSLLYSSFSML